MYISSYLREKRGMDEVKLIDMKVENLDVEDIAEYTQREAPDIVGLSSMSTDAVLMHQVAKRIREKRPSVFIVAGGPHPSSDPEDTLKDGTINVAVIGEGEETFYELISCIDNKESFDSLTGIAYIKNGRAQINNMRKFLDDLDKLPLPAWDLINLDKYAKHFGMAPWAGKRRYASIFTSRGCPYRCTFCHNIFGKRFRARSPENVLKEIELLYNRGISDFEIIDDIFNFNKERTAKILDSIIERGIKINIEFPNGLRADQLDEGLIRKFRKAGTRSIAFAVETASPRLQKLIKKNNRLDILKKLVEMSDKAGIFNVGYFMFGFPGETEEEMLQTLRFAIESDLHVAFFFILNPFKGTEIYREIEKTGFSIPSYEEYESYYFGLHNYSKVPTLRMRIILRAGLILFYLWRFRILKVVFRIPTKRYIFSLFLRETIRLFSFKNFLVRKKTLNQSYEDTTCKSPAQ